MSSPAPAVSVVIPAYESEGTIAATLEALQRQRFGDLEVVVVDSSPGAATAELVARQFPEIAYEHSARRLIPHEARNRGVELASGDLIAFTDPDCVPRPDWLERLVAAVERGHPIVGGAIEDAGQSWFERGVHLAKFSPWIGGGRPGARPDLASANLLWERGAWRRFGPFVTDRWSGDTEISWRARDAGVELRFDPRAVVEHRHEADLRGFLRERLARGEDFARMRMRRQGWSRARAAGYLAALPLIPLLILARALRNAAAAGRLGEGLATAPVQLAGYTAWALGEGRAHRRFAFGSSGGE